MTNRPARLQGTDGIRGRIAADSTTGAANPIDFFLTTGLLTPGFFERYAYAFGCLLKKSGLAIAGNSIVIGWDPRDKEGHFNQAAISGIQKAGLNAIIVGVLPTPAIPLFMLSIQAAGSVVLTASHNPADQNGIKLFCGHTALKFLPPDDTILTDLIFHQRSLKLADVSRQGEIRYMEAAAKDFFVRFCLDSRNSWIDHESFENTMLVVDASNGAVAAVAHEIFTNFSWHKLLFTNMAGNINEHCGVADIEGQESISRKSVMEPGAKFETYPALRSMFEWSVAVKPDQPNPITLTGLVFDGDGDRCFRLDYHPEKDSLIVSSGDLLGIHQARYLARQVTVNDLQFINTVESDLNTAITARGLGFNPVLTGVGDKWLLSRAIIDLVQAYLPAQKSKQQEFNEIILKKEGLSALQLSCYWKNFLPEKPARPIRELVFRIGIEESGHCITPGLMEIDGQPIICFSGNGLKTALNSIKAVAATVTADSWYQSIVEPFPAGIRRTFYIYYVEKARLHPGSPFRVQLQNTVITRFHDFFPYEFEPELVEFSEEKEMLYCSIQHQGKQCAAIFIRNSGTEDKSALYLRGERQLANYLEAMGRELHLQMLVGLKNGSNPFAVFEIELLKRIRNGLSIEPLFRIPSPLPLDRILKEIELKEGLIEKEKGNLILTAQGSQFIDSWK